MTSMKNERALVIAGIGLGIILFFGLLIQLFGLGNRFVPATNLVNQGITTSGEGSISVKPDIAYVTLGMEAIATTAQEAQNKNAQTMAKIISGLKHLGLADKDIQTTDFSLYPERRIDKTTGQDQVAGYRAVNQVTVTVRNLANLGAAIDQSIKNGANNVQNVAFAVDNPGKWREEAIAKAVKEARAKAESLAKASGMRIKRIVAMNESGVEIRPYQMDYALKNEALQAKDSISTPLEPGNVKITANVQMNFGI